LHGRFDCFWFISNIFLNVAGRLERAALFFAFLAWCRKQPVVLTLRNQVTNQRFLLLRIQSFAIHQAKKEPLQPWWRLEGLGLVILVSD